MTIRRKKVLSDSPIMEESLTQNDTEGESPAVTTTELVPPSPEPVSDKEEEMKAPAGVSELNEVQPREGETNELSPGAHFVVERPPAPAKRLLPRNTPKFSLKVR